MTENINDNCVPNSICTHKYCVSILFYLSWSLHSRTAVIYVAEASRKVPIRRGNRSWLGARAAWAHTYCRADRDQKILKFLQVKALTQNCIQE